MDFFFFWKEELEAQTQANVRIPQTWELGLPEVKPRNTLFSGLTVIFSGTNMRPEFPSWASCQKRVCVEEVSVYAQGWLLNLYTEKANKDENKKRDAN